MSCIVNYQSLGGHVGILICPESTLEFSSYKLVGTGEFRFIRCYRAGEPGMLTGERHIGIRKTSAPSHPIATRNFQRLFVMENASRER